MEYKYGIFLAMQKSSETLVSIVQKVICTYGVVALKFGEIEVSRQKQKHHLCLSLKRIVLPIKRLIGLFIFLNKLIIKYKNALFGEYACQPSLIMYL